MKEESSIGAKLFDFREQETQDQTPDSRAGDHEKLNNTLLTLLLHPRTGKKLVLQY
jgi:hypothetical protein